MDAGIQPLATTTSTGTKRSSRKSTSRSHKRRRRHRSSSSSESSSESSDEDTIASWVGEAAEDLQQDAYGSDDEEEIPEKSKRKRDKGKGKSKQKDRSGKKSGSGGGVGGVGLGTLDFMNLSGMGAGGLSGSQYGGSMAGQGQAGPSGSGQLDHNQIAQALSMIQAQQQASLLSLHGLNYSNPLSFLNMSNNPSTNPQQQQQIPGAPIAISEFELSKRIESAMNPLKQEIFNLKSRIECLEADRSSARAELANAKSVVRALADKAQLESDLSSIDPSLQSHDFNLSPPSNNVMLNLGHDIPVAGPSMLPPMGRSLSNISYPSLPESFPPLPTGSHNLIPEVQASKPFSIPRSRNRRAADSIDVSEGNEKSSKGRTRKPELSRAVRVTMFKLMGVTYNAKGTGDKHRSFHGYGGHPLLPPYTPETIFTETGERVWRWDWSRTIRQSLENAQFAAEIRKTIINMVQDPTNTAFSDVPLDDWNYLDEAIESAYINTRREQESQNDPEKQAKKERHRSKNRKRGLKEEKYRRRAKALQELIDPQTSTEIMTRLTDNHLSLPIEPLAGAWDQSLDMQYMSSESEAEDETPRSAPLPATSGPSGEPTSVPMTAGVLSLSKVFRVARPKWRSDGLMEFYRVLDVVRAPERAFKRVLGVARDCLPPPGTPQWMVKPGVEIPQKVAKNII